MQVVRGTAETPAADRAKTAGLLDRVAATGEARLRVWQPPRQLAFGPRDTVADGYERARKLARQAGYDPVERRVGGRAVAHTGSTVAVAVAVLDHESIRARYRRVTAVLERAFRSLGVGVRRGEPDESFCPGEHSLQNGGKIVGIAQRVRREAALVSGCAVVTGADATAIAEVLTPVYEALDVAFDPASVGSLEGAGGPADPTAVREAIESAFVAEFDR